MRTQEAVTSVDDLRSQIVRRQTDLKPQLVALKSVAVLVRMTECGEDTKAGQPLGDGEESNVAPSDR